MTWVAPDNARIAHTAQAIASLALVAAMVSAVPALAGGSPSPEGDPARGEAVYQRCIGCHSLDRNRTGPLHCGLIGRRAGSVPGFAYSEAMRQQDIIWSRDLLNRFLTSPTTMVPGTTMGYAGISDPQERLDLIAYIEAASRSSDTCGSGTRDRSQ